ncbi:hypothetical protein CMUS01_09126 [Colletotrichum musicola]|uniref:Uncharacterized protein n=1 Tax=Colletotrichum musicola TaxID=2175873 RepID=A0A8H6K914_9PEZI|nr:hypothetical protein CMUS01_09126 [Colletotrichum musicola]
MASQPPAGTGPQPAPPAGPDRGPGPPPEPTSTPRTKRRRNTEAQPLRPSLVRSQPNTPNSTPLTAKGPTNTSGATTRSILATFNKQNRLYKAQKDIFITITQSINNVVSSFKGPKKQIAKETTIYIIQALKRLINNKTAPAPTIPQNWATIAALSPTTASTLAPTSTSAPAQNRALTHLQPQAQPEDLQIFIHIPKKSLETAQKNAPFTLRRTIYQVLGLQLADIPQIYHITTKYSLRPLNKQV